MGGVKRKIGSLITLNDLIRQNAHFNPKKCLFIGRTFLHIKGGEVTIGDEFIARSGIEQGIDCSNACKIIVGKGAKLTIGESSGITNSVLLCHESIKIGHHVNIGAGCMIMDSNFHSTNWEDRLDRRKDVANHRNAPVVIGDVVFIGAHSIICKGVTIGDHSMVAAGSVVVSDIPADEVWGGNPARFIKKVK